MTEASRRAGVPFHPLLVGVFPIVSLYSQNGGRVPLSEGALPLVVTLCVIALIWIPSGLALRSARRSALFVSLFLFLFFAYGHVYQFGRDLLVWRFSHYWVSAVMLALFAGGALLLHRARKHEVLLTTLFNRVAMILVAIPTATATFQAFAGGGTEVVDTIPVTEAVTSAERPDVFYIVLDGYGRADVLKDLYDHDNEPFLGELRQRGFTVVPNARANYVQTYLSLASSLNFTYLDDVVAAVGVDSENRAPLLKMITDSRVVRELKSRGYTFVSFSTGYAASEIWEADVFLAPSFALSEFQNVWLSMSPLPYYGLLGSGLQHASHRRRINFVMDELPKLGEIAGPKFVLAHVVAPHPPFVFDAHGNAVAPPRPFSFVDGSHFMREGTRSEYVAGYRGQVRYLNGRVIAAIDGILAQGGVDPIISVQGDHGPGAWLEWSHPEDSNLMERVSILNALRLPRGGGADVYDGMTPVNTFRIILNRYFGTGLELLRDATYFSTFAKPYALKEVPADGG